MLARLVAAAVMSSFLSAFAEAEDYVTLANVPEPPAITAEEPLAPEFSLDKAARSLDVTALHWQKTRGCAACHTMPPYLMARQALATVRPEPPEVRRFFEEIVEKAREPEPALPKDGVSAVVIEVATALAFHDRATTGKLHPRTRQELERMWSLQRPDGGWQWPFRDTPPVKADENYGVTLAALAAGVAPNGYAQTEQARRGLAGIRKFLAAHPPTNLHQEMMVLWAGFFVEGLTAAADKEKTVAQLWQAQRPDGGWSMASLIENRGEPSRQSEEARKARAQPGHGTQFLIYAGRDKIYKSSLASDGYATGLVLYVARQAGVPAADPRIRRGVAWLKSNQRASGRWFTPSQAWHTQNRIANAGSAYAVLALAACGEVPKGAGKAR